VPAGTVLVVTDRRQARPPLPEVVAAAVAGGARWVLLREKDLPYRQRYALAERLRAVLAPVGGRLVVAGPDPLGGDAVHLSATDPPAGDRAAALVAEDYLTVSPVFPSASKPGYGPPLGLAGLAGLVRLAAGRPVLALGGVETPERAAACRAAGAAGVAVMGAAMRSSDPAGLVAGLRRAWSWGGEDPPIGPADRPPPPPDRRDRRRRVVVE
jgi:thiamine monophosphate synthase